jgi:hypothetical protein
MVTMAKRSKATIQGASTASMCATPTVAPSEQHAGTCSVPLCSAAPVAATTHLTELVSCFCRSTSVYPPRAREKSREWSCVWAGKVKQVIGEDWRRGNMPVGEGVFGYLYFFLKNY